MVFKTVTELKDFDPSTVTFSKKTPSQATGRWFCFVNNALSSGTSKWFLQTPLMNAPFGVSQDFQSAAGGGAGGGSDPKNSSMKLTLSFGGNDPVLQACRQKLYELEQLTIEAAVENSVEWFGKKCTREVIENMFFPILKKDPKMQWPDTFSVKIPTSMTDGKILLDKLYNYEPSCGQMQEVPVVEIADHIVRRTQVQVIFSFSQLYFTGSRGFGLSLRAHIVRFVPNPVNIQPCFLDDSVVITAPEPEPKPKAEPEPKPKPKAEPKPEPKPEAEPQTAKADPEPVIVSEPEEDGCDDGSDLSG